MKEKARNYLKTMEAFVEIHEEMINNQIYHEEEVRRFHEMLITDKESNKDSYDVNHKYYENQMEYHTKRAKAYEKVADAILDIMKNIKIGKSK